MHKNRLLSWNVIKMLVWFIFTAKENIHQDEVEKVMIEKCCFDRIIFQVRRERKRELNLY